MAGFSDYYEALIINHMLRAVPFTPPAAPHLALFTVSPADTGGGTEVSAGGYARQALSLLAASVGSTSNAALITFGPATADWGAVVAFGIFDAVTAGNLLMYGNLAANRTILNGDSLLVPVGALTVSVG